MACAGCLHRRVEVGGQRTHLRVTQQRPLAAPLATMQGGERMVAGGYILIIIEQNALQTLQRLLRRIPGTSSIWSFGRLTEQSCAAVAGGSARDRGAPQVGGLVTDGALFTKAWVRAKRGLDDETPPAAAAATAAAAGAAGGPALAEPLMPAAKSAAAAAAPAPAPAAAASTQEDCGSSDSDDSLVE
jgi:hypothetical protein